jgi:hypothetical protein
MGKFEVEMVLTGFKLKIRGERDDMPVIKRNLEQQMAGLLSPAANIAQSRLPPNTIDADIVHRDGSGRPKKASRVRRTGPANGEPRSTALDFHHDFDQFGVPSQTWPAGKKILWLLYIASREAQATELSGPVIAETFNKHFRQSGMLKKSNMPRDLRILKQKNPGLVGDNANGSPINWFLTTEGEKEAAGLVAEAKGEPEQN